MVDKVRAKHTDNKPNEERVKERMCQLNMVKVNRVAASCRKSVWGRERVHDTYGEMKKNESKSNFTSRNSIQIRNA